MSLRIIDAGQRQFDVVTVAALGPAPLAHGKQCLRLVLKDAGQSGMFIGAEKHNLPDAIRAPYLTALVSMETPAS
jgi:hypothetical protein